MQVIERAWQHQDTLYLAMPSSKGGVYIVRVKPIRDGIEIAHACPAQKECWHQKLALRAYREWCWWQDNPQKVILRRKPIILKDHWEQIPVPGTLPPELEEVLSKYEKHIA
jgi:hypothetical protein